MAIDPDVLSLLAREYTKSMTSIRGRRVQRLIKREFAGADHVLLVQVAGDATGVLGLSNSGAALCVTDGTGKEAPVLKWAHGSARMLEARHDLHKDSLPVLRTSSVPLARLRAQAPLRVTAGAVPIPAQEMVDKALRAFA